LSPGELTSWCCEEDELKTACDARGEISVIGGVVVVGLEPRPKLEDRGWYLVGVVSASLATGILFLCRAPAARPLECHGAHFRRAARCVRFGGSAVE